MVLGLLTFTFATASFTAAQESVAAPASEAKEAKPASFEIRGLVTATTKYGFQVQSEDKKTTEVITNEQTAYALRMSRPWFNGANNTVDVDGKPLPDGGFERLKFQLPARQHYLLASFRTVAQRDRLMKKSPWRLNSYLLTTNPIDPLMPSGKSLLIAGELDLVKSELAIDGRTYAIQLGHRGATLLDRSIADLVPNQSTALVVGTVQNGSLVADTVLFRTSGSSP